MHKPVVIWLLTYSYNYSQCIAIVSQHIPTTPPTPFKCLVSSHIYPITLYSHKMCTWMEFHCSLAKFPWWCTHLNELLTSAFSLVGSTFIKPHFFETSPFDASKTWEQPWNCPFLLVKSGFSSFFMAETASRGQPWSVFQASAKPLAWWAELGGLLAERHLGGLGKGPLATFHLVSLWLLMVNVNPGLINPKRLFNWECTI